MNVRPLVFATALAAIATGTTLAPSADACGTVTVRERVEGVLGDHFAALNAHDRARLLRLWNENATVVSVGTPMLIEPIDRAATRWLTAKRTVTYDVASVETGDHSAIAHVNVLFEGTKLEDTILFRETSTGSWEIAGKSSRNVGVIASPTRVAALRY